MGLMELLILIGVFFFPKFTLGCTLCLFEHPILGCIIILISIFQDEVLKFLNK
jgi:hypothetical protein